MRFFSSNMLKTVKLIFLGAVPLVIGCVLNFAMPLLPVSGLVVNVIEIALLFLWGCLAYHASSSEKSPVIQSLLLCSFGLLMLALVLYQELAAGQYWANFIGSASQMYFLPFLTLMASVLTPLVQLFAPSHGIWLFYIAVWICMFAVSFAGCLIKSRKVK